MDSIEYYNQNAIKYFELTVNLDLKENWDRFIQLLPEGASILDLGCGSGRDSAYFISQGFFVTAMDASEEMCSLASIHIGQEVLNLSFAEIDFDEVFDGIWACASLLHAASSEMEDIMYKIINSMKKDGVLFMSFYYGDFEGERDGRYFTDYRNRSLKELIGKFENLELIEIKKYDVIYPDREAEWIHALVRKIDIIS
ncbi:MAG: class SAM-dependent methyltransferase [Herbinix sp.]|nr:class SAM-dependent methyltransferase [Herbinix sp.]